jgi:hypothetical protein
MQANLKKVGKSFMEPYKKRPFRALYLFGALIFFTLSELGVFRATWKEVAVSLLIFVIIAV